MIRNNRLKVAALAASIALAMAATPAMAAAPTANQLPGQGKVSAATAPTIDLASAGTMGITLASNTVIDWGAGAGAEGIGNINSTGTAGFNIGSTAKVNFTGAFGVLNVDSTGNPSQIFGTLTSVGNLYVANTNGIIVGATASITGTADVGLIANTRGTTGFDGTLANTSVEFQGAGGDVTVMKSTTGTGIKGTNVLVSGGGTVNVDLSAFTAGNATIQAGVKNSGSSLVHDNTGATLAATGTLGGATLTAFKSAGNASTTGTLTLGSNARVDGTLTNNGDLTLGSSFAIDGGLVNNKTATQSDAVSMGSLVNNGAYVGGGFTLNTIDGGISNGASMTNIGHVDITNGGDFTNDGKFESNDTLDINGGGNFSNTGEATVGNQVNINDGGDFSNSGSITLITNGVYVVNGSITNSGKLTVGGGSLNTASDSGAGRGFTKGADYSITNTGTMTSAGNLGLFANADASFLRSGPTNASTGSVSNTGILQVGLASILVLRAYNDVNLAGTVQALVGSKYKALSATNPLYGLSVWAGDYDGTALNTDGVATIATDLTAGATGGFVQVYGNQVKLMGNLSSVGAAGAPNNQISIIAGAKSDTDYAVRVASGKIVTADVITIDGDQTGDESNVILQGTLAANSIVFGASNAVSDAFTGPNGGLSVFKNGVSGPALEFNFTGAVKTAKYNNSSNFRFNGLQVMTDGSPLALTLNPTAYTINGTSNGLSAVNLLVNGDAVLNSTSLPAAPVAANGSAVTGVTNIPNTHLVLQSSGNISTTGAFYWPGYVYLGNVSADADGNAMPGTLGLGTITTGGEFNNVLPGDIAGASGIHFITQFPLNLGAFKVVTNANAWVNFGTDLLTAKYVNEQSAVGGPFFGGSQGSGTVVNYGALDDASFHTHAPVATK